MMIGSAQVVTIPPAPDSAQKAEALAVAVGTLQQIAGLPVGWTAPEKAKQALALIVADRFGVPIATPVPVPLCKGCRFRRWSWFSYYCMHPVSQYQFNHGSPGKPSDYWMVETERLERFGRPERCGPNGKNWQPR